MKTNTTVENLRAEHARLDAIIREEESHIWKNLIRIEELKREKLRKKMRYCATLCRINKISFSLTASPVSSGKPLIS